MQTSAQTPPSTTPSSREYYSTNATSPVLSLGPPTVSIHPITGLVTALVSFDRETAHLRIYDVIVSDSGDVIKRTSTATLTVDITDVNDEVPRFTRATYFGGVRENAPPGVVSVAGGGISAWDADASPIS